MTAIATAADDRIPFSRLIGIEVRKGLDTRSGFWLSFVIVGLSAAILIAAAAGAFNDQTYAELFTAAYYPAAFLLPFVGILLVTSEFSARTGLTTFVLVPNRYRVIAAKLMAALLMGLSVIGAVLLATLVAGTISPDHVDVPHGGQTLADAAWRVALAISLQISSGVAFGLLLRVSAAAIVSYMFLPTFITVIVALVPGLDGAEDWVSGAALSRLSSGDSLSSTDWSHIATSSAIWILLPLLVGLWRLNRSEIK